MFPLIGPSGYHRSTTRVVIRIPSFKPLNRESRDSRSRAHLRIKFVHYAGCNPSNKQGSLITQSASSPYQLWLLTNQSVQPYNRAE